MDLRSYTEKNSAAALARLIGVAPSFINQWLSGTRPVPPKKCVEIERATGGAVTRQELRGDWNELWPELSAPLASAVEPVERPPQPDRPHPMRRSTDVREPESAAGGSLHALSVADAAADEVERVSFGHPGI